MSALIDGPSPLNAVEICGEDSKKFLSLHHLYSFAAASLPAELTSELSKAYMSPTLSYGSKYASISGMITTFMRGNEVVQTIGKEETLVPLVELHRPRIEGCTASYSLTYTTSKDFSFSIKVWGGWRRR